MSSKSFEMVAIGGVGGSGTGIVAQLIKDVGFFSFLRTDNKRMDRLKLYNLFKTPASSGRYRQHDLTVLDKKDIEAVSDLGFRLA
jgi:hypothetical protein